MARENTGHVIRAETRAHLDTQVEGLANKNLGIGGAREFWQTVETLWSGPSRQRIQIAIGSSDVTIRTRRNIDDDFSLCTKLPALSLQESFWARIKSAGLGHGLHF